MQLYINSGFCDVRLSQVLKMKMTTHFGCQNSVANFWKYLFLFFWGGLMIYHIYNNISLPPQAVLLIKSEYGDAVSKPDLDWTQVELIGVR